MEWRIVKKINQQIEAALMGKVHHAGGKGTVREENFILEPQANHEKKINLSMQGVKSLESVLFSKPI